MKSGQRKEFSLRVDGRKIVCEQYGHTRNPEEILLFCHGFPGSSRLAGLCSSLKDSPVSIAEIHYRGDKKSEGKFSFTGSITDIRAVTGYLKERYKVPVNALGYSMGGCYVANLINNEPGIFGKVILVNPVVDTVPLFSNKTLMDELWKQAEAVLSLQTPDAYEEEVKLLTGMLNPMGFAEKVKSHVSIIQSTADEVLDPELAKRFYSLLKCEKNFHEIPYGKHDLIGDEEELRILFESSQGAESFL